MTHTQIAPGQKPLGVSTAAHGPRRDWTHLSSAQRFGCRIRPSLAKKTRSRGDCALLPPPPLRPAPGEALLGEAPPTYHPRPLGGLRAALDCRAPSATEGDCAPFPGSGCTVPKPRPCGGREVLSPHRPHGCAPSGGRCTRHADLKLPPALRGSPQEAGVCVAFLKALRSLPPDPAVLCRRLGRGCGTALNPCGCLLAPGGFQSLWFPLSRNSLREEPDALGLRYASANARAGPHAGDERASAVLSKSLMSTRVFFFHLKVAL